MITLGLGGVRSHGCAAISDGARVLAVCEQERITRVGRAGFNGSGLPDQAVDAALNQVRRSRDDISRCGIAETPPAALPWQTDVLDHHEAHACAAYFTSPFSSATILIADHEAPGLSVWQAEGSHVSAGRQRWTGPTPSALYSECARLLGFDSEAGDQRFEALARTMAACPHDGLRPFFHVDGTRIVADERWTSAVAQLRATAGRDMLKLGRVAAALQLQLGQLVLDVLQTVHSEHPTSSLCLGGSLFFHSSINTRLRESDLYERVFVPANPGNAGVAVGVAMRLSGQRPEQLSPFMGPSYDPDAIKSTLDNCKLRYDWVDERTLINEVVRHLTHGRLVGWYEGRMEWGPRALGARSILATPFSPYVLENLNRFLKRREEWRGYAVSVAAESLGEHFWGPVEAPFMECDYRPKDIARFRPVMPSDAAHLRLQAVDAQAPPRFRSLLGAFGRAAGVPCLVNTSFNGFHEPIVCTPRDAVRVFYGSGLDVLVLDQFLISK